MLAERYLRRQRLEGRKEGRQEGRQETQKMWEAWNQRRLDADRNGVLFEEPPPTQPST